MYALDPLVHLVGLEPIGLGRFCANETSTSTTTNVKVSVVEVKIEFLEDVAGSRGGQQGANKNTFC